jgi:hypothetical protein
MDRRICLAVPPTGSVGGTPAAPPALAYSWPLQRLDRPARGSGVLTRCPSTTPLGLALGPD